MTNKEEAVALQPSVQELRTVLCDEQAPVAQRMRTVFLLKDLGGSEAVEALCAGLESESVLLCHEIAYVMGQMQDLAAVPTLQAMLQNKDKDPIIRHEAAEALGALGHQESLPMLEKYAQDPDECDEVRETCEIAVDRIRNLDSQKKQQEQQQQSSADEDDPDNPPSIYFTVDPAPPLQGKHTVQELYEILVDKKLSLYRRYEAMFKLRNIGSTEAVQALSNSLLLHQEQIQDSSGADNAAEKQKKTFPDAVFRHEICYVLGQMQHPTAIDALTAMLRSNMEHAMVRHEAAEALGSIAESAELLEEFRKDEDVIVAESCDVALDLHEYWSQQGGEQNPHQ